MYSQQLLDYYLNPRCVGDLKDANLTVEVENPVCGDTLRLAARLDGGVLQEVRFKASGCVPAVACASWLAERIQGEAIASLTSIGAREIEAGVGGVPAASRHGVALALEGLRRLLEGGQDLRAVSTAARP